MSRKLARLLSLNVLIFCCTELTCKDPSVEQLVIASWLAFGNLPTEESTGLSAKVMSMSPSWVCTAKGQRCETANRSGQVWHTGHRVIVSDRQSDRLEVCKPLDVAEVAGFDKDLL